MAVEQDREYFLLKQLLDANGQTLIKFEGTRTSPRELALDGPTKNAAVAKLVADGFVVVNQGGKKKAYSIADAGKQHLRTLPPFPRPTLPDPKLKAYILLRLFMLGNESATLKDVKAMLQPATARLLGTTKDSIGKHIDALVAERVLTRSVGQGETQDEKTLLRLTDKGRQELVLHRQQSDIEFKLYGAAINRLIECAIGRPLAEASHAAATAVEETHKAPPPVPPTFGRPYGDDELIKEAKGLMARHPDGLLPIYELRRQIRQKFGPNAAGAEEFDRRLKRLRGQRVDLISLYDPTPFKRDQLDEGVQGVGELFFYVRNLR